MARRPNNERKTKIAKVKPKKKVTPKAKPKKKVIPKGKVMYA